MAVVIGVLLAVGGTVVGATSRARATAPPAITPFVATYSPGFLESLDCAHLPIFAKLSVNQMLVPLSAGNPYSSYPITRSSQGERQAMVWQRLLVYQVNAQLGIQRTVDANAARLTATQLSQVRGYIASAQSKLGGGMLLYGRQTLQTLWSTPTASCCVYALGDQSYPWSYPGDAAVQLSYAVRVLTQAKIASGLSDDLQNYVTRLVNMSGFSDPSATIFITNKNNYYDGALSEDAKSTLEATNDLHMQVADAGVCIRFHVQPDCGDVGALRTQLKETEIAAARQYGLPLIAFYSQEVSPTLSDQAYCVSVQRAHLAYTAWMEAVRDRGNTQEGFRDAWMASLAHAYIHAQRALGVDIPPMVAADANYNPPGLNPATPPGSDQRLPLQIRRYLYAVVPGIVNGTCDPHPNVQV